jgi:hypothetical protein
MTAMELLLVVAILALLGIAAQAWGSDSRILDVDPRQQASSTGIS